MLNAKSYEYSETLQTQKPTTQHNSQRRMKRIRVAITEHTLQQNTYISAYHNTCRKKSTNYLLSWSEFQKQQQKL